MDVMKTFTFPRTDISASNIVLGLMRISSLDDEQIRTLVRTARDEGVTMFDHADIYGTELHGCERRFGDAAAIPASERDQVVIQSKVGIRNGFFDFSREHILHSVDESLAALRTDYLDILLLHRPDTLVEPEEVALAFDELQSAGKVRAFGVSNQTPGQIELLQRSLSQPLVANQVQLSITHAPMIAQGVAANMAGLDQSVSRDNGILDYARLHDIVLQAWSPFQKGFFDGVFLGDRENYAELNDAIDELAEKYDVTPTAIAVAWITRHPAGMQVVLGTTNAQRVRDAAAGSEIPLTRQEWYRLFTSAGHTLP
jgi:predicted oxidoreductase